MKAKTPTRILADQFLKRSRAKSMGLVLDMQRPGLTTAITGLSIQNADARKSLDLARKTGARYLVVAGQMHRADGGAFAAILMTDDVCALSVSATVAFRRLTEIGETDSLWMVLCDEQVTAHVLGVLAELSATEGTA